MLALLGNLGLLELMVIAVLAILIFGKDLPQAASKAYLQVRKLRNAVDEIRRESGIDREIRDIERTVREAEWEARRATTFPGGSEKSVARGAPRDEGAAPAASGTLPPPHPEAEPPGPDPDSGSDSSSDSGTTSSGS